MLEPEPVAGGGDSESEEESEAAGGGEPEEGASGGAAAETEAEVAESGGSAGAEGELAESGGAAGSPSGTPGAEGQAGGAGGNASVDAELLEEGLPGDELEGLEGELNESLQVFDGELQRRITILASADGSELEGGASGSGGGGEEDSDGGLDQTGEGNGLVLVDGDLSELEASQSGADSGGGVTSGVIGDSSMPGDAPTRQGDSTTARLQRRVPPDVGDGSDDDVVARQIREAAMNEPDPALREKLWEEYRNYKKSIR